jgi:hypothetical protein
LLIIWHKFEKFGFEFFATRLLRRIAIACVQRSDSPRSRIRVLPIF